MISSKTKTKTKVDPDAAAVAELTRRRAELVPGRHETTGLPLRYLADLLDVADQLEADAAAALAFKLAEARADSVNRPQWDLRDLAGVADLLAAPQFCAMLKATLQAPADRGHGDYISPRDRDADRAELAVIEQELAVILQRRRRQDAERRRDVAAAEVQALTTTIGEGGEAA